MSKEQIEEMACAMCGNDNICGGVGVEKCIIYPDYRRQANRLYNAGYRNQSEGRWKQEYNNYPRYVCTNCNHLFNNKNFKYCPNCGAKMRKEDEGK